jgi:hypothetical protein
VPDLLTANQIAEPLQLSQRSIHRTLPTAAAIVDLIRRTEAAIFTVPVASS